MNCLCCGKTLNNGGIDGWHKKCIKKFFGTNEIPEIDINKSNSKIHASRSSGLKVRYQPNIPSGRFSSQFKTTIENTITGIADSSEIAIANKTRIGSASTR